MVAGGGDEDAAGFDEAAGEEAGLADGVLAVALLDLVRFAGEIEGVADGGREDHLHRLRAEGVQILVLGGFVEAAVAAVDRLEERTPAFDGGLGDGFGEA